MDEKTFRMTLREQGYPDSVVLDLALDTFFDDHSHEFSWFAYLVAGEFTVKTATGTTTAHAGESFKVKSRVVHSSWSGTEGAKILTGRKTA